MEAEATTDIPKAGEPLTVPHFDMIMEAVAQRRVNFPDEPPILSMASVLFNIGDRFAPVTCQELEWEGYIQDVDKGEGVPRCPNGHTLVKKNPGLRLGWLSAKEDDATRE